MSTTQRPVIEWSMQKTIDFYKKLYECVHDEGMSDDGVFTFEGHEFVIGYAKYLIHHLQTAFNMQVVQIDPNSYPRDHDTTEDKKW